MRRFLTKYSMVKYLLGGLIGAILGFSYFYFVGCHSGTCAITSSALNSSIYGVLVGALLADSFPSKNHLSQQHDK